MKKLLTKNQKNKIENLLKENGFKILEVSNDLLPNTFIIEDEKNFWGENVKFVRYVGNSHAISLFKIGKIVKLDIPSRMDENVIIIKGRHFLKEYFQPASVDKYKDQLIKDFFERFGELKKGDIIELLSGDKIKIKYSIKKDILEYDEEKDVLFFEKTVVRPNHDRVISIRIIFYSKGKWLKKIERVEVTPNGSDQKQKGFFFKFGDEATERIIKMGWLNVNSFLAKCLEDKLNE
jgi:hypothetical protein